MLPARVIRGWAAGLQLLAWCGTAAVLWAVVESVLGVVCWVGFGLGAGLVGFSAVGLAQAG